MTKRLSLGDLLTQDECDAGLEMLALAGLPRASTGGKGAEVRALYWELLREAGVTGAMFKSACRRIIIAEPIPGKTKFFPDPGQLVAMCSGDIEDRRRQLASLNKAFALLEAPPQNTPEELVSLDRMREIRAAVERKVVSPRQRQNPAPAEPRATIAEVRARVRREMKLEDVESPTSEQA